MHVSQDDLAEKMQSTFSVRETLKSNVATLFVVNADSLDGGFVLSMLSLLRSVVVEHADTSRYLFVAPIVAVEVVQDVKSIPVDSGTNAETLAGINSVLAELMAKVNRLGGSV
jgi:hypothetical protein